MKDGIMDRWIGLHERLTILYVVDGYEAELATDDGERLVASARGETVANALQSLAKVLASREN